MIDFFLFISLVACLQQFFALEAAKAAELKLVREEKVAHRRALIRLREREVEDNMRFRDRELALKEAELKLKQDQLKLSSAANGPNHA